MTMSKPEKKRQPRRLRGRSLGDLQKYNLQIEVCQKDIDILKRVCRSFSKFARTCQDMSQFKNLEELTEQISSKFMEVRQSSVANFFFYIKESDLTKNADAKIFFNAKRGDKNVTEEMVRILKKYQIEVVEVHGAFCLYAKLVTSAFKILMAEDWIGHYENEEI
jgi:hypothetical protein